MYLMDQSKPGGTNLFAKYCKLHNFATWNWNFKNSRFSDMQYQTNIQAEFEINRSVRSQITTKRNYSHRRQTDGRTDGWTDVAYDNNMNTYVVRMLKQDGRTFLNVNKPEHNITNYIDFRSFVMMFN